MLGKASEIKLFHICVMSGSFHDTINDWKTANPDVEIIEIKFSATAVPNEQDFAHALIIYKEESYHVHP